MSAVNIPAIIDAENIDEVLELRQWLQDTITQIEHEHTQLTQFLQTIEMLLRKPALGETQTTIEKQLDNIKQCFAPDLCKRLVFTYDDSTICIRPRRYLDRPVWQGITSIINQLNGHWLPAGADSHWVIPMKPLTS
jgi:hypothetical protein